MAGILVAGRVVEADGDPVGGATVMFSSAPVPVPDIAALTAPDGSFSLVAPAPGRYVISVRGPGGGTAELAVDVGAVPPGEVEIVLA